MTSFNVDHKLLDKGLIKEAIIIVCKNKHKKNGHTTRKYKLAQHILSNLDKYTDDIYDKINQYFQKKLALYRGEAVSAEDYPNAFVPSRPRFFTKKCDSNGKIRDIACVPLYPDQIIHQVVVMAAQPVFMRGMYRHSCGSVPSRGVHDGVKYLKRKIKTNAKFHPTEIKNAAQLDVKKCYPHVDHQALKTALQRKFRGKLFLWLCFDIIDSYDESEIDEEPRGLPIGYYTSQWFLNFLLTPLDHYIIEVLHIKIYVRYVDDIFIMGRNKKYLHHIVDIINSKLNELGLRIKENWQVFRFDYIDKKSNKHRGRFIDILGFRFYRDKIIQRRRNALRLRRNAKRIRYKYKHRQKISLHMAQAFISRLGALRHCNSKTYYMKYIKPFVKIRKIKGVISDDSRKQYYAKCAV